MARGELMKRLLASYGREDEFRSVAEEIIREEEQKDNRVLARSLRRTLESTRSGAPATRSLAPLLPFPDGASEFVERLEPRRSLRDLALTKENQQVIHSLVREFRRADEIRSRGLPLRSKLLFCGPLG
jgi:hypothetical protein